MANSKSHHSNLAWLLWREARLRGDSPAIIGRAERATYRELRSRASSFANAISRAGVARGDRVAIYLDPGLECAAAYFGVVAAGAITIVLNEALRPRQVEHIVRHSGAKLLLTSDDMLGRLGRPLIVDADIFDIADVQVNGDWNPVDRGHDEPVQVIYTSASTGLPKGVVHSHRSLRRGFEICADYLGLTPDDRVAGLLPFSSIYGLNQLVSSVSAGASLVLARSPVAAQSIQTLREAGATIIAAVPPLWCQLVSTPAFSEPLPALRQMQNAGGHLPRDIVHRLRTAQPQAKLVLQYGMTEVVRSTFLMGEDVDLRPDSIGRAMPGSEVMVLRDDLTLAAPGELGQLVHRGPTVALRYLNDPEATARTFRAYPFGNSDATERVVFSGDLVRRDEDGYLYFVGRRDRMIKSLGYSVGPDEIVDALHASGAVQEVEITTVEDARRGDAIVAHVVLRPGNEVVDIERFCRAELPRWMQPSRVIEYKCLPKTPNGKLDFQALRATAEHTPLGRCASPTLVARPAAARPSAPVLVRIPPPTPHE